jgi:prepilin-type N-terminal cleavage/methylation domain-containing protein
MQRLDVIRRRGGFTLIELLVVIGIITLLVGLLLPAIHKIREAAMRAKTKSEIGELGNAVEQFKSTYDVKYIPTAFILSSNYSQNPAQPPLPNNAASLAALNESRVYYSKVWPKGFLNDPTQPLLKGYTPLPPNSLPLVPNGPALNIPLDGNQALLFFLGGIPPSDNRWPSPYFQGNRTGFYDSPTNPFYYKNGVCNAPDNGSVAKGPFYNFRLDRIDTNGHYHDPYWDGQSQTSSIYYYFSSRNGNDYDYFGAYQPVLNPGSQKYGFSVYGGYGGMHPFRGLDGKYINPNGFQIVSPGRDTLPGPGGYDEDTLQATLYDPGVGKYSPGGPGGDDISNFATGPLGGSN